ncbi:MAG: AAA family ATPase [gamma proteobacterium symbiont of Bathyaustriella thionipta]|nr:AAA family ATPase [gamma proteobacterium symbiont of Bathyaustriella thionipta]
MFIKRHARHFPFGNRRLPVALDQETEKPALKSIESLYEGLPYRNWSDAGAIATAFRILRLEFPWMLTVIDQLEQQASGQFFLGSCRIKLPPLLLVGLPGTGKTRFCKRLGKVLALPSLVISVAGSSDNRNLTGTARGWGSAQPSIILRNLASGGTANPLYILDELDKGSHGRRNGRITDSLLQLLEPENASVWVDEFAQIPADIRPINWIATANTTEGIEAPLLSRWKVMRIEPPRGQQLWPVVHATMANLAEQYGIPLGHLPPLSAEELSEFEKCFTRKSIRPISPRVVRKAVEAAVQRKLTSPLKAGVLLH